MALLSRDSGKQLPGDFNGSLAVAQSAAISMDTKQKELFMKPVKAAFLLTLLAATTVNLAWACGHPPTEEPKKRPEVWVIDQGVDPETGLSNLLFGVEIDPQLFPISEPTACTCGIGVGGVDLPFVPSLKATSAMLAVTNKVTHEFDPLEGFDDFLPDTAVKENAESGALIAGQQWFGLSTLVEPDEFSQPDLGDDENLKLLFSMTLAPGEVDLLNEATVGQFVGFTLGGQVGTAHPPEQFVAFRVPEPGSLALMTLGVLLLARRGIVNSLYAIR